MTASSTKSKTGSGTRKPRTKAGLTMLATCPVDGSGWCSYPFSPEQLQRRLRAKAREEEVGGKAKPKSRKKSDK